MQCQVQSHAALPSHAGTQTDPLPYLDPTFNDWDQDARRPEPPPPAPTLSATTASNNLVPHGLSAPPGKHGFLSVRNKDGTLWRGFYDRALDPPPPPTHPPPRTTHPQPSPTHPPPPIDPPPPPTHPPPSGSVLRPVAGAQAAAAYSGSPQARPAAQRQVGRMDRGVGNKGIEVDDSERTVADGKLPRLRIEGAEVYDADSGDVIGVLEDRETSFARETMTPRKSVGFDLEAEARLKAAAQPPGLLAWNLLPDMASPGSRKSRTVHDDFSSRRRVSTSPTNRRAFSVVRR